MQSMSTQHQIAHPTSHIILASLSIWSTGTPPSSTLFNTTTSRWQCCLLNSNTNALNIWIYLHFIAKTDKIADLKQFNCYLTKTWRKKPSININQTNESRPLQNEILISTHLSAAPNKDICPLSWSEPVSTWKLSNRQIQLQYTIQIHSP